jgi:hypothetical protein
VHYLQNGVQCASSATTGRVGLNPGASLTACRVKLCAMPVVKSLAGQNICLDHFISSCYERLDSVEALLRNRLLEDAQIMDLITLLRECSDRVLVVSLRQEQLNNMDRARLLNILLLSWDLQCQLRKQLARPGNGAPGTVTALASKHNRQA